MKTTQSDLDQLHDSVLETVTLDWAAGTATLSLRLSAATPTRCLITVEGVTSLRCPRHNPWGPSKSVNEADLEEGGKRLVVHMQSGDDLVFEGAAAVVTTAPI